MRMDDKEPISLDVYKKNETHCRPAKWDCKPVIGKRRETNMLRKRCLCVRRCGYISNSVNSYYHLLTGDVGEYAFVRPREEKCMFSFLS